MRMAGRGLVRLSLLVALSLAVQASGAFAQVAAGKSPVSSKTRRAPRSRARRVTVTRCSARPPADLVSSGEGVFTAPSLAPGDYE